MLWDTFIEVGDLVVNIMVTMALQQQSRQVYFHIRARNCPLYLRSYKTKAEWRKLRPMILERIKQRAKDYPVTSMIPVAHDVLKARDVLIEGVSNILQIIPVKACRHCSEVCIGHIGHHIQTCRGPKWGAKNMVHEWIEGNINNILVPVESFHLRDMFQNVIKHDKRFDFDRIPAVVELCIQAGVDLPEYPTNRTNRSPNIEYVSPFQLSDHTSENVNEVSVKTVDKINESPFTLPEELRTLAKRTLQAWERTRLGTKKLMFVYPVKVCQFCSEVHIGPSGHKARLCGIFKYQSWRGHHMWKSANLDDLIPPRYVWHIREQDVPPLLDVGRGYYGHAPAVVELCVQAGAAIPRKYHCMMKISGLRSA